MWLRKYLKDQRGISLVEVLIVLAITMIFMASAVNVNFDSTDLRINTTLADASRIDVAVHLYLSSLKVCPDNLQVLQNTGRIPMNYDLGRFTYTLSPDKKLYKIEFNSGAVVIKSPGSTL